MKNTLYVFGAEWHLPPITRQHDFVALLLFMGTQPSKHQLQPKVPNETFQIPITPPNLQNTTSQIHTLMLCM